MDGCGIYEGSKIYIQSFNWKNSGKRGGERDLLVAEKSWFIFTYVFKFAHVYSTAAGGNMKKIKNYSMYNVVAKL
jgi:hypothetical protein